MTNNGGNEIITVHDVLQKFHGLIYANVSDDAALEKMSLLLTMLEEHLVATDASLREALNQRDELLEQLEDVENTDIYERVGEYLIEGFEVAMWDKLSPSRANRMAGMLTQFLFELADNQEVSVDIAEHLQQLAALVEAEGYGDVEE